MSGFASSSEQCGIEKGTDKSEIFWKTAIRKMRGQKKVICEQKQSFSRGKKSLSYDSSHPAGEGTTSLLPQSLSPWAQKHENFAAKKMQSEYEEMFLDCVERVQQLA